MLCSLIGECDDRHITSQDDGACPRAEQLCRREASMTDNRPITALDTHQVLNQPPPLEGGNLFAGDRALADAVARAGGAGHGERLARGGRRAASAEAIG